jgi:dihydroorotate dehydrogenase
MYRLLRPLLFKLDPETAHHLTLRLIRLGGYAPFEGLLRRLYAAPPKPVEVFGLRFPNPVGLAAGYDKDGLAWKGLATLGFGHIEIGTVTPLPQQGNPRPRVFRLVEDEGVINRMGFPGLGAEAVMGALRRSTRKSGLNLWTGARRPIKLARPGGVVLGVNLGKNKVTPNEGAVFDYLALVENFAPLADYLAINVSSPNTVGLRKLQGREALEALLGQVAAQRKLEETRLDGESTRRVPVLVKLAPDLSETELDDALDTILRTGMDGVIVTNTTLGRDGLRSIRRMEEGGLSGAPLRSLSETVLERTVRRVEGRLPVVSAGGIMSPEDAMRRLDMGAALVQVYTGLVYAGPSLVKSIVKSL